MKPSKRKEAAALSELQLHHFYMFCELKRKDERFTLISSHVRGRLTVRPGIAIKLIVPEDSVLGREVAAMRKRKAKISK